jgi:hypothetical protein
MQSQNLPPQISFRRCEKVNLGDVNLPSENQLDPMVNEYGIVILLRLIAKKMEIDFSL